MSHWRLAPTAMRLRSEAAAKAQSSHWPRKGASLWLEGEAFAVVGGGGCAIIGGGILVVWNVKKVFALLLFHGIVYPVHDVEGVFVELHKYRPNAATRTPGYLRIFFEEGVGGRILLGGVFDEARAVGKHNDEAVQKDENQGRDDAA